MNEDKKGKMKVLFPDNIETITISKNDYDRLYGDLAYQNIELQQENARLKDKLNKINDLLNEPIFEHDNIPCNIENEIIQLKDILKEN